MTIATMEWAIPQMLKRSLSLDSVKKAKFTGMVRPNENLCLVLLSTKEQGDKVEVSLDAKVGDALVAKAQLSFRVLPTP